MNDVKHESLFRGFLKDVLFYFSQNNFSEIFYFSKILSSYILPKVTLTISTLHYKSTWSTNWTASAKLEHERQSRVEQEWKFNYKLKNSTLVGFQPRTYRSKVPPLPSVLVFTIRWSGFDPETERNVVDTK